MPFNYNAQLNYMPVDQKTLDKASATPFTIAGKAMTQLNDAIDNRAFERDISSVKDLQGLSGLTARTPQQQALVASKQGIFTAQALQESRGLQNQLAQGQIAMLPQQQAKAESDLLTSQLGQQEAQRAFDMKAKATKELSQGGVYNPDKFSLQFGKDGSVVEQGVSPTGFNALSDYERISAERQLDPKGQSATFDLMQEKNDLTTTKASNPTYVQEFKGSSAWLANNPSLTDSAEGKMHQTVVDRFSNNLSTASMKDTEYAINQINKADNTSAGAFSNGQITKIGLDTDSAMRTNTKNIYTPKVQAREDAAYDTADSVANLADMKVTLNNAVNSGKYKSGYLDSTADWFQSKTGSDFIKNKSSGEIGSYLSTRLAVDGELAIQLGKVVKAAYGGNASNTDRETIAGAMAGLTSDDEKTRNIAFNNFNRSVRKMATQDIEHFKKLGLYRTVDRLQSAIDIKFDERGLKDTGNNSVVPTFKYDKVGTYKGKPIYLSGDRYLNADGTEVK